MADEAEVEVDLDDMPDSIRRGYLSLQAELAAAREALLAQIAKIDEEAAAIPEKLVPYALVEPEGAEEAAAAAAAAPSGPAFVGDAFSLRGANGKYLDTVDEMRLAASASDAAYSAVFRAANEAGEADGGRTDALNYGQGFGCQAHNGKYLLTKSPFFAATGTGVNLVTFQRPDVPDSTDAVSSGDKVVVRNEEGKYLTIYAVWEGLANAACWDREISHASVFTLVVAEAAAE